jgi:serine/threonine protein kinase
VTDHLVVGGQLGNYLIDSVLGRGGMSVVYRAKHSRLGMPVALKVLAPELSSDDVFRERFLREAQMAAAVDHPNVIPIHDMGVHEQSLYIVMRYVAGGDLKALLATAGPLEPAQAVALLMPVALALDTAHAHGLVHRDVKPANILIQRSQTGAVEHVYLTDFGIAKSAASITELTSAGAFIGTVEYMAPEQLESREVSARTDVYALAATFYQCVTGRIPFHRELAEGVRPPQGPADPVNSLNPGLPSALDGVIAKALSRDPFDRYVTCEQFLRACAYVLGAEPAEHDGVSRATVAPTQLSAHAAGAAGSEPVGVAHEPPVAQSGSSPPADGGRSGSQLDSSDSPRGKPKLAKRGRYAVLLVALIAAAVAIAVLASSSSTPSGRLASSRLLQVPTNHVTGTGTVTIRLNGNRAAVTVTTTGLDENAPLVHAIHIHAGGKGICPPASAARPHNGHLTISTTDGIAYYGPPVQALTTRGDTSVASILAFPRFLSGGTLRYTRTITLPPTVAEHIRENDAVIVVHGIDYDHSGIYSGVLESSELDKRLPGTATAPALCGRLVGPQEVARQNPRAPRRGLLLYTASLADTDAQPSQPPGEFLCHAPEAPGDVAATPRQPVDARASVRGQAAA